MSQNTENSNEETKLVTIRLAALTRVEYSEVVEVPKSFNDSDLEELAHSRFGDIDGDQFTDDPDYWERGYCYVDSVDDADDQKPSLTVKKAENGGFDCQAIPASK